MSAPPSHATDISRRQLLALSTAMAISPYAVATEKGDTNKYPPERPDLRIQRLSWAGIKIEFGKTVLFIDAWTDTSIWDGAWKTAVVPLESKAEFRFAAISNSQNDHFDPKALRSALTNKGAILCHAPIAAAVAVQGIKHHALQLYEPVLIGDYEGKSLTVIPVPAADGFGNAAGRDQVSWVVIGGGKRLIHCGETAWHSHWWKLSQAYGPFDAAFMPINGVQFSGTPPDSSVPATLTPQQAVSSSHILRAKLVCPIHYGISDPEYYREHPNAEAEFIASARNKNQRIEIVKPGDWLKW